MMKKWQVVLMCAVVAVLGAGIGAYAASSYGTQSDPLVTVSYLTDTLEPSMKKEFENQLNAALEQLERNFEAELASATGSFAVVTLTSGQTLEGSEGCEILYRSGSVSAIGSLVDISSGGTVSSGGSLTANHLYMVSASGDGVKASATVTLLVRGTYVIS